MKFEMSHKVRCKLLPKSNITSTKVYTEGMSEFLLFNGIPSVKIINIKEILRKKLESYSKADSAAAININKTRMSGKSR